jgi:hypothetical protein
MYNSKGKHTATPAMNARYSVPPVISVPKFIRLYDNRYGFRNRRKIAEGLQEA